MPDDRPRPGAEPAFRADRLLGRRPQSSDAENYCRLFCDPSVSAWIHPPPRPPFDEQTAREVLERDLDHWERHDFGPVVLVDRADGGFLGRGGLNWTIVAGEFAVELPWALFPARWGEGLATEAARAAIAWARDLELGEVIAFTLTDNLASRRVMEKAGLQSSGDLEHAGLPHVLFRLRFAPPARATVPFWQDRPYAPRPGLATEERCEVCVIGGGMGGVAAAFHLVERGVDAVLLEAATVAGGASGRNGGFLIAGAAPMYHETCRLWGHQRARRIHQATLDGQETLVALAQEVAPGAVRRTGLLRLAMDEDEAEDVLAHYAALDRHGFPGEIVEEPELPPVVRRPGRRGLLTPHDGGMHPVELVRAIADAVARRGVRVFESTPATAPLVIEEEHVVVSTERGRVLADRVVVALDGQLAGFLAAAGAIRSRRLNACATAPAPSGILPMPVYARYGLEYAQQLADGRVVLGGFSDLDGEASWTAGAVPSEPVQRRLDRYLREELGVRAPVTHRWAGIVGFAEDPMPRCGPVPQMSGRVFALGGYNGTGNVQSFVAARIVSELLTTGRSRRGPVRARRGIGCQRSMRALQISELSGPDAVRVVDVPEPGLEHSLATGESVLIEVRAAGVSFPDVLQTRGLYQYKPELPFVPGAEVAGVVLSAPGDAGVAVGDRVAGFTLLGGLAERAVAPPFLTFPLPEPLDFAQGAALLLNYHTALFALQLRGRLREGETVLVHGAAGGVGTAALQVAKGLGARTIAVVSTGDKEAVAREAGADDVLRSDAAWRDQARELTNGGVDLVLDPVGGDRFTDSLRALREGGRLVVVGFTGGAIPEVKVNRLLLRNTEVVGAGWGAYVLSRPQVAREMGETIESLVSSGFIRPLVGARFPLEEAAQALKLIDGRGATGKVVLELDGVAPASGG